MAWTAPMTAVDGNLLTATEYNQHIRDNTLMLAPAIASAPGSIFVIDDNNRVVERQMGSSYVAGEDNIKIYQNTFKEVQQAGPMVTLRTGTRAIVSYACEMKNRVDNAQANASFEVSGATVIPPSNEYRLVHDALETDTWTRMSVTTRVTLNAGINTFRMKYHTGNRGPIHFRRREIVVLPL